jgi:hypothetical protein
MDIRHTDSLAFHILRIGSSRWKCAYTCLHMCVLSLVFFGSSKNSKGSWKAFHVFYTAFFGILAAITAVHSSGQSQFLLRRTQDKMKRASFFSAVTGCQGFRFAAPALRMNLGCLVHVPGLRFLDYAISFHDLWEARYSLACVFPRYRTKEVAQLNDHLLQTQKMWQEWTETETETEASLPKNQDQEEESDFLSGSSETKSHLVQALVPHVPDVIIAMVMEYLCFRETQYLVNLLVVEALQRQVTKNLRSCSITHVSEPQLSDTQTWRTSAFLSCQALPLTRPVSRMIENVRFLFEHDLA